MRKMWRFFKSQLVGSSTTPLDTTPSDYNDDEDDVDEMDTTDLGDNSHN